MRSRQITVHSRKNAHDLSAARTTASSACSSLACASTRRLCISRSEIMVSGSCMEQIDIANAEDEPYARPPPWLLSIYFNSETDRTASAQYPPHIEPNPMGPSKTDYVTIVIYFLGQLHRVSCRVLRRYGPKMSSRASRCSSGFVRTPREQGQL